MDRLSLTDVDAAYKDKCETERNVCLR
jgi:hypothetical protein